MKLTITKADLLKNQASTPGWYKGRVKSIKLDKAKTGNSYNFVTVFEIEENGKEITNWFNTQAIGAIAPLVESITGAPIDPSSDFEIDTDVLVGEKLQVHIINDTYQGRIVDKIDNYAPYSAEMSPML